MRHAVFPVVFGVVVMAYAAVVTAAGPLDKDATSKERGDWVGNSATRRSGTYRAYSYAPQQSTIRQNATAPAPPADSTDQSAQENKQQAQQPKSATRSFSYQGQTNSVPYYAPNTSQNRNSRDSRFFHAERKALGEY